MQQKIVVGLILTLIIVIFIPYYWLTEPARQQATRERLQNEAVARGSELYATQCAGCHGVSGEGGLGPALKNSPLDETAMTKIISRGVPGTLMPALASSEGGPLKPNQINDLVAFIKNPGTVVTEAPATSPAPTTPAATSPPPATANAGALYAAKCAACHGAKREGGLGPPLTPQSLAQVAASEVQGTISEGRVAKGMPPFGGILTSAEIDALTQFLKNVSP